MKISSRTKYVLHHMVRMEEGDALGLYSLITFNDILLNFQ